MKSLLRSSLVTGALGLVIWAWMALVGRTVRWTIEGSDQARRAWEADRGLVVAAWHEQILLLPSGWTRLLRNWPARPAGVSMLVSLSRDAEPVAKAIEHLGIGTIRGSKANARKRDKDKGGVKALAEAIRLLKASGTLCVTPDGPRGPARNVSDGPLLIAHRSGAHVMSYALCVSNGTRLNSWDRMRLPWLFGRGAIVFGEPLDASAMTPEALRSALQSSLEATNARAQTLIRGRGVTERNLKDAA